MAQKTRVLIALIVLIALSGILIAADLLRRQARPAAAGGAEITLSSGSVPIYLDGRLAAGFTPADLSRLEKVSFVEPVEGAVQEGWLLKDIILLYLAPGELMPGTQISVSSSSRGKAAQLSWDEVNEAENWVMFDLSNRGTLKLVSQLEKLDEREEWVQDTDRIEINNP